MAASCSFASTSLSPKSTTHFSSPYISNLKRCIYVTIPLSSSRNSLTDIPFRFARRFSYRHPPCVTLRATTSGGTSSTSGISFHGKCYVVGDNIDTDQITPAEYLTLAPSNPSEYEELGSKALSGLPSTYPIPFISPNETKSKYSILIAGENFGRGPSGEHARAALAAAGVEAIVAGSYGSSFSKNSMATGGVCLFESKVRVCDLFRTGDEVTVEIGEGESRLINRTTGKELRMKPTARDGARETWLATRKSSLGMSFSVRGKEVVSLSLSAEDELKNEKKKGQGKSMICVCGLCWNL